MRVWLLCVNNRVCSCLNHHKLFILSQWRRGIKTATHIHRHTYTKTHTRTDEEAKSLHLTLSPKPPPLPAHSTSASISFLPSQDVKVKASPAGCKQLSGLSWDTAVTRLRLSLNPSTKRHAENTFLKRLVLVPALQWGLSLRGTLCFQCTEALNLTLKSQALLCVVQVFWSVAFVTKGWSKRGYWSSFQYRKDLEEVILIAD